MISDGVAAKESSSYPHQPGSDGLFAKRILVMITAQWGQALIVAHRGALEAKGESE